MSSDILNHLWQSTVFAIVAGALTLAFRRNRAQVRYWLWFSASVKFLLPFGLLLSLGGYLGRSQLAPSAPLPAITYTLVQVAAPIREIPAPAPSPRGTVDWVPLALVCLWACGFTSVVSIRLRGWLRIRAAVRASTPMEISFPIPVRSSTHLLEPGIIGIFQQTLLFPAGIAEHFTPNQLQAILTHELCHARRRDNLTAAIQMIVEALFWFHPLVWWISARLLEERERACDEWVLEFGSDRHVYAESILKTCQFCKESPLACMSRVTGADLKKRILRIMTQGTGNNLSFARKMALAAVGIAAVTGPVFFGLLNGPQIRALSTQTTGAPLPALLVAVVKQNRSGDRGGIVGMNPDRFTATNATIRSVIESAYNVRDYQLSGGPSWVNSERYDIDLKVEDSRVDEAKKLTHDQRQEHLRLRLQSLLADRFHLKLGRESKEFPLYALVVAENGPKLRQAKPGDTYADGIMRTSGLAAGPHTSAGQIGQLTVQALPMASVARLLSLQLGCHTDTIVDKTGLTGDYDLTLQWTPDQNQTQPCEPQGIDNAPPPQPFGPSIFTAIQEQLGLKLEPEKAPLEVLAIDHIERPSEN